MATFVILSGAFTGGYYMKKVADRLRQAGHEVFTPTYTGLGERSHLLSRDIDLETHIQDVLQVLKYEALTDVLLVGKSYSGMIISAVADRVPERIRHVIYLDAAVPVDGQCLLDLIGAEIAAGIPQAVQAYGDGWLLPANREEEPRLTDHPWKTAIQPVRLTGNPAAEGIPCTYIICTAKGPQDLASEMTRAGLALAKTRGWNIHEIDASHEVEQEKPDEVAQILLGLA